MAQRLNDCMDYDVTTGGCPTINYLFERLHRQLWERRSFPTSPLTDGALIVQEAIPDIVTDQPNTSTRSVARQLHVSSSMTWRVLQKEPLHTYNVQRILVLTRQNYSCHVELIFQILELKAVKQDFGKTHFLRNALTREGAFNIHNQRVRMYVNPYVTFWHAHQRRFSINVWSIMIGDHLLKPYLRPESLDGKTYPTFMNRCCQIWNCASPHTVCNIIPALWSTSQLWTCCAKLSGCKISQPMRWIGRGCSLA